MSLSLRYINNVDPYLKSEIIYFGKWLRDNYDFETPLEIRLINQNTLIDFDGTKCALRWWQNTTSVKAEIAVKSFKRNLRDEGASTAFPTVIAAIGRAVYYYNKAISDSTCSEKSAAIWGDKVMDAFIDSKRPPSP